MRVSESAGNLHEFVVRGVVYHSSGDGRYQKNPAYAGQPMWHNVCYPGNALPAGTGKPGDNRSIQTKGDNVIHYRKPVLGLFVTAFLALAGGQAFAHGDVTPQAVDITGLDSLGADWKKSNPYRKNKTAERIGTSAYTQNCARCHGIEAVSGGIAPDLRYLPAGDEGDEIFLQKIRRGSTRDGRVYMPPFEGILQQEAMWAIRAYLETVRVD